MALWTELDLAVDEELLFKLQQFVTLPHDQVMTGAIGGITALVDMYGHQLDAFVRDVFRLYDELAYVRIVGLYGGL